MYKQFFPVCLSCIHLFYENGIAKCKAFGRLNLYTNEIKYLPCLTARSKEKYCGVNGHYWFAINQILPPISKTK